MRILLPVDGSSYSDAAVAFVASRSSLIGREPEVRVLNVQAPVPPHAARAVGRRQVAAWYAAESEKVLRPAVAILAAAGIEATATVEVGQPGTCIAAQADADNADLVVMGSHGQSALQGLLMGSTAQSTLAQCRHPVLLLRGRAAPRRDTLAVGIAVDGSRFGRQAVKYVLRHFDLFGAAPRLSIVHVVPDFAAAALPDMAGFAVPSLSPEEVEAAQRQACESVMVPVRALLHRARVEADEVCLSGTAGDEIAAWARKKRIDVLVLGSHGHGALRALLLGSVATRVAAHCTTPLLLVRD